MESYKPSLSFIMATAPKAKYRLEIDSIAFLFIRGAREDALKFMREMRVSNRIWWTVCIAGVLRWCIWRDSNWERNGSKL